MTTVPIFTNREISLMGGTCRLLWLIFATHTMAHLSDWHLFDPS